MKNLKKADTSPMKFPIGMHSIRDKLKNIIINGVEFPPPPSPPALQSIISTKIKNSPADSNKLGGIGKSVNLKS